MSQASTAFSEPRSIRELFALWQSSDPWAYDLAELAPLQLQAFRDRFQQRRPQLKVLDQRARDQKIDCIRSLHNAVPLLFSHTTYKSYPDSFVEKGRWGMMLKWLDTLSTRSTSDTHVRGVTDLDGWMRALHAAGHLVVSSSGTTGRSSYLNMSLADRAIHKQALLKLFEVSCGQKAEPVFPYFWTGPREGWNGGIEHHRLIKELFARPGDDHYISNEGISIAELDRLASIRKAILEGTATPDLIAGAEKEASDRLARMEANIQRFMDDLYARRSEPVFLYAGASMLWRVAEAGRSRGLSDGAFHPGMLISTGGGMKGFRGPSNFREEALCFFGMPRERWVDLYGMTELITQFVQCSQGHFHCPPTTILLILDKSGDHLLNPPSGMIEGRAGFFDLALDGRWGGIISGDRLKVNFSPCACGRKSASVLEITRYKDLPEGDDKLTCAGQIDTYVRGFMGGDWQQ